MTPPPAPGMHTYGHGRKYFGGFYFYLDILATLTLLLDIEEVRTAKMTPHCSA